MDILYWLFAGDGAVVAILVLAALALGIGVGFWLARPFYYRRGVYDAAADHVSVIARHTRRSTIIRK